ncbi:MAG: UvrD-helicase domain-containing protein [Dehalococcoidales bacterium]|jgi:DNA helicase-2/ATP-dependent DNA helicase PcrA
MTEMDFLAGLNSPQRAAVEEVSGPVLILAGPGSGKTRVIAHRVAYLIKVVGISPRRIMAVTFTNKAANEMRERVAGLVSGSASDITLGTFHAISARILRQDGKVLGISPQFVIYDGDDQISLIKRSLQEVGLDPKQYPPRSLATKISDAKSRMLGYQEYQASTSSYFEEVVGRVYERYQQLMVASSALDFDDLLLNVVELFKTHPEILEKYQARYLHVMVDEFQDTNLVQYEIVKQLSARYRNLCVVGDPDQSIYSWRSADIRNILNFEQDYPEAKVIMLEQNYRSTGTILEAAAGVIEANRQRKPKALWTEKERGALVSVVETYDEREEARFVVGEVERLVDGGGVTLGDCAVMYRTNAQSRVLEETFIRYGTPYKLVAGTRFYERREIKDIIAYLRFIQNPADSVSLLRIINVPGRGIGQKSLEYLRSLARTQGVTEYQALRLVVSGEAGEGSSASLRRALADFSRLAEELIAASEDKNLIQLFDAVIEGSGYRNYLLGETGGKEHREGEERWDNVLELRAVAEEYSGYPPGEGLVTFLEGVALVADVDSLEESPEKVTLITLHQAKGLEFPVVFIVGLEEGLLPHIRSFDDPGQMEEERRLCYVGITRAERHLYLVRAFRRNLMGLRGPASPSRFLSDLPQHLVQGAPRPQKPPASQAVYSWNRPVEVNLPEAIPSDVQFSEGDKVRHSQFGEGVVVSLKPSKGDIEAVVAFEGALKKLLLSFAHLEKVD